MRAPIYAHIFAFVGTRARQPVHSPRAHSFKHAHFSSSSSPSSSLDFVLPSLVLTSPCGSFTDQSCFDSTVVVGLTSSRQRLDTLCLSFSFYSKAQRNRPNYCCIHPLVTAASSRLLSNILNLYISNKNAVTQEGRCAMQTRLDLILNQPLSVNLWLSLSLQMTTQRLLCNLSEGAWITLTMG